MNKNILKAGIQDFINKNSNTDITAVLLKGVPFQEVSAKEIAEQIEARKKCETKLPTWFNTAQIYYPNKLSIEQTSSESTARYKAGIVSGKKMIDLSGGFGVDSYFFAQRTESLIHCEINEELSKIVTHNYEILGVENIRTVARDGLSFLQREKEQFDWIYTDPSRRDDVKGKVFMLSDCTPNVPENLDTLLEFSSNILIKTSPLLDISVGLKELSFVKEIHVVALNNEVKELLWVIEKGYSGSIVIKTINLKKDGDQLFDFIHEDEKESEATLSLPLKYIYEPNAAILKAGAFKTLAGKLGVHKLHKHSHLYTSDKLLAFPGRVFSLEEKLNYQKKQLRSFFKNTKAHISTRNFPESVAQVRKNLKIAGGGNLYCFFTTDMNNDKIVLCCKKSLT
ncbi:class I SAM-dependent methyltransferase [Leptobacterium flavescens]|uniref:Class I SAM-dependent methyltransferase n=1 Tax=Leptobacterium flavescens TaxID=472055 RepID=A0A6P0ULX3_9FLAO|nr:class I SAM-dependent methyltransferase [Leptobacterium flavescens]NER14017.1 class I SAM-dependent methyltransferase [Leptobacterium flavescens]